LYLKDILEAIRRVREYVGNKNLDDFSNDKMVVDAVLRNLEIIGEATTQLSKNLKEKHTNLPWRDIQDFRIVVAHHYWKINKERIWDIIENKLDSLKEQVEEVLNAEEKQLLKESFENEKNGELVSQDELEKELE